MPGSKSSNLPKEWLVTDAPDGGVDLRLNTHGRRYFAAGMFVIAIAWTGLVLRAVSTHGGLPLIGGTPKGGLGLTALLALWGFWLAFGSELWHVKRNCIEHRVGIEGTWQWIRRYEDADLEIVGRLYSGRGQFRARPYYRLYAVSDGQRHFLFERNLTDLKALAGFLAGYTRWRIRLTLPHSLLGSCGPPESTWFQ